MATSLELAITAIRSGRREEGRQLLNLLIQQNPNNEMAWLWMSSVVDNDEQRARCLYHVLAIDPGNAVARQGLKVLGIVVSDSRPVKVPRDSQPINIPKPTPQAQNGPFKALPASTDSEERRPFRIDPQSIVDELPFTPVKTPFSESLMPNSVTSSASKPVLAAQTTPKTNDQTGALQKQVEPRWFQRAKASSQNPPPPKRQTGTLPPSVEPAPVTPVGNAPKPTPFKVNRSTGSLPLRPEPIPIGRAKSGPTIAPRQKPQTGPLSTPLALNQDDPNSLPKRGQTEPMPTPAEPIAPAQTQTPTAISQNSISGSGDYTPVQPSRPQASQSQPQPLEQSAQWNNGPMNQQWVTQQGQVYTTGQPAANGPMALQDTRPTPPMSMPQAPTQVYPTMEAYPGYNGQPGYGAPYAYNSNMPMQHHSQAAAAINSQVTMGMPINGQMMYSPQGGMPMVHANTTMGVPLQMPMQQPQNPALHSNSTMVMQPGQPNLVDYGSGQPLRRQKSTPTNNKYDEADEENEGINILAVIIFGSLSVTALGGLGMLLLLMFTGN